MARIEAVLPFCSIVVDATLGKRSVVRIASAKTSALEAESDFTNSGRAASIFSAGSGCPITPVDAGSVQLSWDTEAGMQYEVKSSSTLDGWAAFDPPEIITGDDTRVDRTVPFNGNRQFYQLTVELAVPPGPVAN